MFLIYGLYGFWLRRLLGLMWARISVKLVLCVGFSWVTLDLGGFDFVLVLTCLVWNYRLGVWGLMLWCFAVLVVLDWVSVFVLE